MPEKFDRLVAHIKQQYEAKGFSPDRADSIAYATANKMKQDESAQSDETVEESADDE